MGFANDNLGLSEGKESDFEGEKSCGYLPEGKLNRLTNAGARRPGYEASLWVPIDWIKAILICVHKGGCTLFQQFQFELTYPCIPQTLCRK